MKAKKVHEYFLKYEEYLMGNLLEDDSDEISVEDLINFVENIIIPSE